MMRTTAVAILAGALAGCAGTQTQIRMLEQSGQFRLDATKGPDFDYTAEMRNVWDVDYDFSKKPDRDAAALLAIKAQCPAATIVREDVIRRGEYVTGRPDLTYQIRMRCQPA